MFFVNIFVCFKSENIGNNGPFPLLIYCALPIASLDLIYCIYNIYILLDTFFLLLGLGSVSLLNNRHHLWVKV